MSTRSLKKHLSRYSFFSGSALAMAFSLLSVIGLLLWWHKLITRHLEIQYRFFSAQVKRGAPVPDDLLRLIRDQDEKLAGELFPDSQNNLAPANAREIIEARLENRRKMVIYELTFFVLLLFSGHLFLLYIYFRERQRRRLTEETILLATHELRQPLQSLSLALETVQRDARGASKTAISSGLNDINRLAQHIRWLATSFAGAKLQNNQTQLASIASWFAALLREEFNERELKRLQINLPDKSALLCIEENQLHFILRNLTENALRYALGTVEISAQIERRRVRFTIANAGARLQQADFRRLGNLFFRSPAPDIQNTSGFGLGLYLCGRIARRARGRLTLLHDGDRLIAELLVRKK
jgi:signal transduction histidine kinase